MPLKISRCGEHLVSLRPRCLCASVFAQVCATIVTGSVVFLRCERCKRAKKGAQYCFGIHTMHTSTLRNSSISPTPPLRRRCGLCPCFTCTSLLHILANFVNTRPADMALATLALCADAGHHLSPGDPRPSKARRPGMISVPLSAVKKSPKADMPHGSDAAVRHPKHARFLTL